MDRKSIAYVVIFSFIFGGIGGWFFTRYLVPKLNTIPFLVKYNLAPSAGPLVINTRQEIRVNEGSDSVAAIQKVKPWVVGIMAGSDVSSARIISSGLILTSDGLIGVTKSGLPQGVIRVKFFDGNVMTAVLQAQDPQSELAIIKVDGRNLPTASLGFPKDLQLGQRIIVISAALGQYQATDIVSFLSSELRNINTQNVMSSERIYRTFGVDALTDVSEGSVVISLDSNVHGIYSKNEVITSETIKSALNSYFKSGSIKRNYIGINYQYITKAVSNTFSVPEGVIIRRPILAGSPAQKAGLLEGDIVYEVDGIQVNFDNSFEELMAKYQPGDTSKLSIQRGKEKKTINLVIGSK